MKLFGRRDKIIDKTKNEDRQFSWYLISKSYAYLLNVEPNISVFLKTYITRFGDIFITFTDENGKPLEILQTVTKPNFTLLINK